MSLSNPLTSLHLLYSIRCIVFLGKRNDGTMIKEFEASHGTVADLWHAHNAGKETSMNPLGMVDALLCAMNHAATLALLDVEGRGISYFLLANGQID